MKVIDSQHTQLDPSTSSNFSLASREDGAKCPSSKDILPRSRSSVKPHEVAEPASPAIPSASTITDIERAIVEDAVRDTRAKVITDFVGWLLRRGDELWIDSATFDRVRRWELTDEDEEEAHRPLRELISAFGAEKASAIFSATWDAAREHPTTPTVGSEAGTKEVIR